MYKVFRGGVLRLSDGKYIDNNNHTEWKIYNDWLNQGNTPQPADPTPEPTITVEDLRDNKVQQLEQKASQLRGRLNQGMDHNKYLWLMVQREEAKGPGVPAPGTMIAKVAQKAGITPNQVKDIINSYFNDKIDLGAEIEGVYLKHLLALRALTTKQEIRDYNVNVDWPDIPLKRISER